MITEYIQAAMQEAQFELMENGRYFATIPSCQGVWAEGATIEECTRELPSVLESWLLLGLQMGHELPVMGGIDLNPQPIYAEAY